MSRTTGKFYRKRNHRDITADLDHSHRAYRESLRSMPRNSASLISRDRRDTKGSFMDNAMNNGQPMRRFQSNIDESKFIEKVTKEQNKHLLATQRENQHLFQKWKMSDNLLMVFAITGLIAGIIGNQHDIYYMLIPCTTDIHQDMDDQ